MKFPALYSPPQIGIRPGTVCLLAYRVTPSPVTVGKNGRAPLIESLTTSGRAGFVAGRVSVNGRKKQLLIPSAALVSLSPAK